MRYNMRVLKKNIIFHKNGKKNYILVKTSPDVCILLILLWNTRATGFGRLVVTQQENYLAAGNMRVIETP